MAFYSYHTYPSSLPLMSAPAKLTKKQKKALAFRERKGKGKAKEDQEEHDVPIMEDQDIAATEVEDSVVENTKADQHDDKGRAQVVERKKRKRNTREAGDNEAGEGDEKKPKKRKKEPEQANDVAGEDEENATEKKASEAKTKSKQQRLILFVGMSIHILLATLYALTLYAGNLKYTTTKEAVEAHFAECGDFSLLNNMEHSADTLRRPTTYCAPQYTKSICNWKVYSQVKRLCFHGIQRKGRLAASPQATSFTTRRTYDKRGTYCRRRWQE